MHVIPNLTHAQQSAMPITTSDSVRAKCQPNRFTSLTTRLCSLPSLGFGMRSEPAQAHGLLRPLMQHWLVNTTKPQTLFSLESQYISKQSGKNSLTM